MEGRPPTLHTTPVIAGRNEHGTGGSTKWLPGAPIHRGAGAGLMDALTTVAVAQDVDVPLHAGLALSLVFPQQVFGRHRDFYCHPYTPVKSPRLPGNRWLLHFVLEPAPSLCGSVDLLPLRGEPGLCTVQSGSSMALSFICGQCPFWPPKGTRAHVKTLRSAG